MKDYSKEKGFWTRLKSFVGDIEVNDHCGYEEKEMILSVSNKKLEIFNKALDKIPSVIDNEVEEKKCEICGNELNSLEIADKSDCCDRCWLDSN